MWAGLLIRSLLLIGADLLVRTGLSRPQISSRLRILGVVEASGIAVIDLLRAAGEKRLRLGVVLVHALHFHVLFFHKLMSIFSMIPTWHRRERVFVVVCGLLLLLAHVEGCRLRTSIASPWRSACSVHWRRMALVLSTVSIWLRRGLLIPVVLLAGGRTAPVEAGAARATALSATTQASRTAPHDRQNDQATDYDPDYCRPFAISLRHAAVP